METDYLVVGGGATGLAFADMLLDECDAHITIVDRHAAPGGHWNDAYPFVALHQPSAFYGVNSMPLGTGRKDDSGPNAGFYELAGGPEILAYYDRLLHGRLLPSGRVRYLPLSDWRADGSVVSLLSGATTQVRARRKTVIATAAGPEVPSTHKRNFSVAPGVRVVPPNDLPRLWMQPEDEAPPRDYCVLGGGKTGMDACVWLLRHGVPADRICWVVPRDSWIQNRLHAQPGLEFFAHSIGGEANRMAAFAESATIEAVFLRLEASGEMLRLDPHVAPTMFHYATISEGELQLLRTIGHVVRKGRVLGIDGDGMALAQGRVAMPAGTLYVDCTATAVPHRDTEPVFQEGRIVLQLLRAPLLTLSAAMTASIEVHGGADDAAKNALAAPVPFPRNLAGYAQSTLVSMSNQMRWMQHETIRRRLRATRLDGFGKMVSEIAKDDVERQAVLARVRDNAMAAVRNMPRLAAAGQAVAG